MNAKIYCEVTCCNCGGVIGRYYRNAESISILKEHVKDWVWDNELFGNLCPECQKELKKK